MSNFQKRCLVFLLMMGCMCITAIISFDLYRWVLFLYGSYAIGNNLGDWSAKKWPTS